MCASQQDFNSNLRDVEQKEDRVGRQESGTEDGVASSRVWAPNPPKTNPLLCLKMPQSKAKGEW